MRTFLGVAMLVIGVPLAAAGAVAAVYIGPDNTIGLIDEDITSEAAVVTTTPAALNATGPTLHVAADAGPDGTFVGAGHPVHVGSYLDDITVEQITGVGWRGGLTLRAETGADDVPTAAPDGLDWWREYAVGPGEQSITFEMTDEPVRLVIAGAEPATGINTRLTIDAEIDGLFSTALVITGVGVILTAGGILTLVSARRRKRAEGGYTIPPDDDGDSDDDGADAAGQGSVTPLRADSPEPPEPPAPPPPPRSPGTLARLALGCAATGLVLAGCAEVPGTADHRTSSTVPAITPTAAEMFFEHYTEINNTANSEQDAELIATVEAGPLLASSQLGYEIQEAQDREPIEPFSIVPTTVAAPEVDTYPMWFVAISDPGGDDGPGYYFVTRENAAAPWLVALSVYPSGDAPRVEPVAADGVATPASTGLVTRGRAALDLVLEYASTGTAPDGLDASHGGGLESLHDHGLHIGEGPGELVDEERDCTLLDDNPRWLATPDGAFAMTTITCTQTMVVTDDDFNLRLPDDGFGILPGDTALAETEITHGVSFIVTVDDDGAATVIGESMLPHAMDYTEQ
ncbi:hypothetical protein [Phytoactinopolyspora limicola]|uniref:hypothetical protein n=1 Tax=Phytoactinopolyspora limicola TaxID=2715536 RepID=UPI0014079B0B|nr:hypothetical protein [Phytoactinopolyspora limicola]